MWIYMQVISLDRDKPIYSHFNRLEIMDDKTPRYLSAALLSGVILHTINVSLRRLKAKLTCVLPFELLPCTVNCWWPPPFITSRVFPETMFVSSESLLCICWQWNVHHVSHQNTVYTVSIMYCVKMQCSLRKEKEMGRHWCICWAC